MSTYDELRGTVSRCADAAIEWDMGLLGWWKADNGWVSDITVDPMNTYTLDFTGMQFRNNEGELFNVGEAAFIQTDFRALWRSWYERMHDAFRPWLGFPDPADYEAAVGTLQQAAGSLNINTTASTNGAAPDPGLESGNAGLDSDLMSLCGEVIAMNGFAMDTFANEYSNRVPGVIRSQLAIASMLGCCLTAEQNLWARAREDLAKVADDVLEVMEDQDSGSIAGLLKIVGAVLAGASLFFTGGASAALIANGSTVVGVLSAFAPEDKAPTPAELTYGGSTPDEVLDNLLTHLDEVNKTLREEEEVIQKSLTESLGEVDSNPDIFDLSQPPALLAIEDGQVLHPEDIDVKPETLVFLATRVVPDITALLRSARDVAAGAADPMPWERDGGIGLGPRGPYGNWVSLHDRLIDVLGGTAQSLDDVGQKLIDVASLFVDADQIVRQGFAGLGDAVAGAAVVGAAVGS